MSLLTPKISNAEILWIATVFIALALTLCVSLDGAELEANATTGCICTEVLGHV